MYVFMPLFCELNMPGNIKNITSNYGRLSVFVPIRFEPLSSEVSDFLLFASLLNHSWTNFRFPIFILELRTCSRQKLKVNIQKDDFVSPVQFVWCFLIRQSWYLFEKLDFIRSIKCILPPSSQCLIHKIVCVALFVL